MKNILGVSFQFCVFYSSKGGCFFFVFFLLKQTLVHTLQLKHTTSNEGKMQDGEVIFFKSSYVIYFPLKES